MSGSTFLIPYGFYLQRNKLIALFAHFTSFAFVTLLSKKTNDSTAVAISCHLVLSGRRIAYSSFQSKHLCLLRMCLNLADII